MAAVVKRGLRRVPAAVLAGVGVVVAVALVVGGLALIRPDEGPAPLPERIAVLRPVTRWLQAWQADDRDAMVALAGVEGREREAMLAALGSFRDGLGGLQGEGGGLLTIVGEPRIVGDRAVVPFDAVVGLGGHGIWPYRGELTVVRVGGDRDRDRWRPVWDPGALHPSLSPTRRFELALVWPARAELVLGDGRPAAGRVPASLLGRVAPATAEQAAALGPPYVAGHPIGVSGLQASQERVLAGTPTAELRLLDGDDVVEVVLRSDGSPPRTARVTIEPGTQSLAEEVLEVVPEGKPAALVAIRPSTGDIVAEASRPSGGFDRALLGRYPPGSTFKVVTTLALLAKGVVLDEMVPCPVEAVIGGRRFVNAEGHELGTIPFRRAFAESCNTAFVQLAQRLSPEELHAAAVSVGFDTDLAVGVPTATSSMPVPSGPVDQAASSIGQGRILASPLQMAAVAAAV
ncbi:MAG: penicillin-binding transpeptidase domain-containing protein, partial [Acidimicrobiia bacterium]